MVYREVTLMEIVEVLRQWLLGAGMKVVARRLGLDRNTVRRYVRAAEECGLEKGKGQAALTDEILAKVLEALEGGPGPSRGEGWERCAKHRAFIEQKLAQRLKLTKVRKLLLRRGVEVSYATLHRFAVAELDFGRQAATIPVADGKPGEELQLDTGWVGQLLPGPDGRYRRFRAWIFIAVVSRCRFVYPCFRETTLEAIEACEAAWAFFGGVFHVLIPDNTKAIVQDPDPLDPVLNPTFLEYAQARGFVIDPTRVRAPRDKARVERAVQPVRNDCFAGEELESIEAAREHGRRWCLTDYGMQRHSSTLRMPLEHFEAEEKAHLLSAPTAPYEVPLWCDPKVARDQHAQVARALYSLPRRLVGRTLRARADRTTVRFYLGRELVKTHPRAAPGKRSTDPADFPPEKAAYAFRDIAFLQRQAAAYGPAVGQFAHALLEGPLPWTRMRRVYALLGLCRRYGNERAEEACARALEADMHDVRRLQRMLEQAPPPATSSKREPARIIPLARYLRPPKQYALPFTDTKPPVRKEGETR
jgi:transposase